MTHRPGTQHRSMPCAASGVGKHTERLCRLYEANRSGQRFLAKNFCQLHSLTVGLLLQTMYPVRCRASVQCTAILQWHRRRTVPAVRREGPTAIRLPFPLAAILNAEQKLGLQVESSGEAVQKTKQLLKRPFGKFWRENSNEREHQRSQKNRWKTPEPNRIHKLLKIAKTYKIGHCQ